jgi:hypothetical protein
MYNDSFPFCIDWWISCWNEQRKTEEYQARINETSNFY